MKLIKRTLLCLGVAAVLPVYATNVQIANSQFDATTLADNTTTANISGWNHTSGIAGLFNPDQSAFLGEQGLGAHRNTLYMIDNASVSQEFYFRTLVNSTYTLSFDVGRRVDISTQNYTIKVTAGNETLVEIFNPIHASESGKFVSTEINFTNKNVVGELMKLTIETEGTGHVHFDNFELQYKQVFQQVSPALRPVAYAREEDQSDGSKRCLPSQTLHNAQLEPYLKQEDNACSCTDSDRIVISENVNERYILCALPAAN